MSVEMKRQVVPFENDRQCECGRGVMRPDGLAFLTSPPKYPHSCTACGKTETLPQRHPFISYEVVG